MLIRSDQLFCSLTDCIIRQLLIYYATIFITKVSMHACRSCMIRHMGSRDVYYDNWQLYCLQWMPRYYYFSLVSIRLTSYLVKIIGFIDLFSGITCGSPGIGLYEKSIILSGVSLKPQSKNIKPLSLISLFRDYCEMTRTCRFSSLSQDLTAPE